MQLKWKYIKLLFVSSRLYAVAIIFYPFIFIFTVALHRIGICFASVLDRLGREVCNHFTKANVSEWPLCLLCNVIEIPVLPLERAIQGILEIQILFNYQSSNEKQETRGWTNKGCSMKPWLVEQHKLWNQKSHNVFLFLRVVRG